MKNDHAVRRHSIGRNAVFAALLAFALLLPGAPAGAQVGAEAPPAYGVAQRLQAEAKAAADVHDDATAHNRAYQAVLQLQQVVKSRQYGKTHYAQDALRQQAALEEHYLQDKNAAIQSLQTLHNTFPEDTAAPGEIARVGTELDTFNKTVTPRSTPFHIFGAGLYHVLDFLVSLTGRQSWSYWLAILLLSVIVKLALTPLSNKQYRSMKEMQKLQPLLQGLQAKHKGDPQTLMAKQQEIYKEHGVSMFGGCLPLVFQLPIMYTLYYTIRLYQYQFSHGTFLWIGSPLAHQFPQYLGINLGQPDIPILLLYAASMYVTQKMTVTPTMDPQQAETQKMMAIMTPFMTTYFFLSYHLPSAFVLYYLIFNVLSTAQQKYYMRKRAGDSLPGPDGGDGGSKRLPALPSGSGGGSAIPINGRNGNGANGTNGHGANGNGGGRRVPARTLAENVSAGDSAAAPTAKGILAPPKVHPKKKRR